MHLSQRAINEARWEDEAHGRAERRALENTRHALANGDTRQEAHVDAYKRHQRFLWVAQEYPIGVEAFILRAIVQGGVN